MKDLEKRAIDYALDQNEKCDGFFNTRNLVDAYKAGAKDALASLWKDPKVEMPEDEEYVLIYGDRDIEPAVWNEHCECWDDAEGDDYMYSKDAVKLWMSIPDIPE